MALFVHTHRWWLGSRDADLRGENLAAIETSKSLQSRVSGTNKNTGLVKVAKWTFVIVLAFAAISFAVVSDLIVDGTIMGNRQSRLKKLLFIETIVMLCFALYAVGLFYVGICN